MISVCSLLSFIFGTPRFYLNNPNTGKQRILLLEIKQSKVFVVVATTFQFKVNTKINKNIILLSMFSVQKFEYYQLKLFQHEAGEVAQHFRVFTALAEDSGLVLSTRIKQFPTVCNSNSWRSVTFFWPLVTLHAKVVYTNNQGCLYTHK